MPSRMIACSLALLAFAAAIVSGAVAGNPAVTTLWRALLAMVACYAAGHAMGWVAERVMEDHIQRYKQAHPLEPTDGAAKDAAGASASATDTDTAPAGEESPARPGTERAGEEPSTEDASSPAGATEQAAA